MITGQAAIHLILGYCFKVILDFFTKTYSAFVDRRKKLNHVLFELNMIKNNIASNNKLKIENQGSNTIVPEFYKLHTNGIVQYYSLLVSEKCGELTAKSLSAIEIYNRHIELFTSTPNYAKQNSDILHSSGKSLAPLIDELITQCNVAVANRPSVIKVLEFFKVIAILSFFYPEDLHNN